MPSSKHLYVWMDTAVSLPCDLLLPDHDNPRLHHISRNDVSKGGGALRRWEVALRVSDPHPHQQLQYTDKNHHVTNMSTLVQVATTLLVAGYPG